jgi:hypothetical protein
VHNFVVEYRDTTSAGFGIRHLAPAICNDIHAGIQEAEHIGLFKIKFEREVNFGIICYLREYFCTFFLVFCK